MGSTCAGTFRRLSAVLAILAGLSLAPPVLAEQWYYIATGGNGDRFFVDTEQLAPSGPDRAKAWVRTDFREARSEGLFKPKVAQVMDSRLFDCPGVRSELLTRYWRDNAGSTLNSASYPEDDANLQPDPPGSVGLQISNFVCSYAKHAGRPAEGVPMPDVLRSRWEEVTRNTQGERFFIAADRIIAGQPGMSGAIEFYVLAITATPQAFGLETVKEWANLWMVNCSNRAALRRGAIYFGTNDRPIFRYTPIGVPSPFRPKAGSVDEQLMTYACAQAAVMQQARQAPDAGPAGAGQAAPPPVSNADTGAARGSTAANDGARDAGKSGKDQQAIGSGTAWYVDGGYFVTAFHVIDGADKIVLYGSDRTALPARIAAADPKNDVAILSIDSKEHRPRPLPLGKASAALGQRVFTIGYPLFDVLGVSPKVTSGEVSGNLPLDPTHLLISVPIQAGNSGGPLLNMNGEVVGLVVEKLSAPVMLKQTGDLTENTNFALKSRYIEALLEDLPRLQGAAAAPARAKAASLEDLVAAYRDSVYFVLTRLPSDDKKQ